MPDKITALVLCVIVAGPAATAAAQESREEIVAAAEALTADDIGPLLRRAEAGDATAQLMLGLAYNHGYGVQQDYVEAARWCREAAEQGLAEGQYEYGLMLFDGNGVPQDNAEAFKWFNRAAGQGSLGGQTYLGVMYVNGLGVPQNAGEGARYLFQAARQGSPMAQANLGALYANGVGVAQDNGEALTWLLVAEAGGFDGIQPMIAQLRGQMTEAEAAEIQQKAEIRYDELLAVQAGDEADEPKVSVRGNPNPSDALVEIGEWLTVNLEELGTFSIDVTRDVARARSYDEVRITLRARHTLSDVWYQGCQVGYTSILLLDPRASPMRWEIVLPLGLVDIPAMRVQAYQLPAGWRPITGGSEVLLRAGGYPAQFFIGTTPGPEHWKLQELSIPVKNRGDAEDLAEKLREAARICGAN